MNPARSRHCNWPADLEAEMLLIHWATGKERKAIGHEPGDLHETSFL